ncbi:MAG: hypoxanthine phosphoribosyltransferase [bacterium]
MNIRDKKENQLIKLFSEEQIQNKVKELAEQVNEEFLNSEDVIVIGVLSGAVLFVSDLIRHLDIPVQLEFIKLSSYGDKTCSSGKVKPVDLTLPDLRGKDVLIVEDIIDTGLTTNFLVNYIKFQHEANKIKLITLIDKACMRIYPVNIDFIGYKIDNKFVVGYGMDYKGYFRNLPYIGYFQDIEYEQI